MGDNGVTRRRFKYFMPERNEFSAKGEEPLLSVSEHYGVKPRSKVFDDDSAESRAKSLEGYRIVKAGDFVMNYMLAWKGAYGVSEYDGIVSPAYAVYRIDSSIADKSFIHHRLRSEHMYSEFRARSKGIIESRLRLYPEIFLSMDIDIPDLKSQKVIADFLDRETARIDKLIEKKQRLVELAEEKRFALITAAVSGAANLLEGEFKTCAKRGMSTTSFPIRALFDIHRNSVEPFSFGDRDVFHYSLPTWHETGDGRIEKANEIESLKLLISEGEILVSKLNPEKGAVVHVVPHRLPIVASTEFIALKPRQIQERFGYWLMLSAPIRAVLSASVESVTNSHKRARVDRFLSLYVDVPDTSTQKEIADFLDRETASIDSLKTKTLASMGRLCEYRSALTTAAVMGQIDVATWSKCGQTYRSLDAVEAMQA